MDSTLPIACSLTPEAVRARKADLLPGLVQRAEASEPLPNGLRLRFSAASGTLQAIASTIDAERQCCRFLRFDVTVEPGAGPIWMTVTGPTGTSEFLDALLREQPR